MAPPDLEKIKRLQAQATAAKGGGPRRKPVRAAAAGAGDDKKLSAALKKLSVQPIAGIEEVNMFQEDGSVMHFSAPKVHAAVNSNTYAIYGRGDQKELTELVPGILNQLGPDSLASLRRMAEQYNAQAGGRGGLGSGKEKEPDDDDVPDLVESFDLPDDVKHLGETTPAETGINKLEELE